MPDELTTTEPEADLPDDLKVIIAKKAVNDKIGLHNLWLFAFVILFFISIPVGTIVGNEHATLFCLALFIFSIPVFALSMRYRKKRAHGFSRQEYERLFSSNDKRVIGTILQFVSERDEWFLTSQRRDHLQNLLSLLTPEDTHLLTEQHKKVLVNLIRPDAEELTFAALNALEKVGDSPTLEALKTWRTTNSSNVKSEVREAYAHCVKVIQQRCATEKTGEQLLRPSFPSVQKETLLLPVEEKPDEDAETLLRPEAEEKEK